MNQRREIFRGSSDFTGEFVVEEIDEECDGKQVTLRRLIFLSSPNIIQSEAKIVKGLNEVWAQLRRAFNHCTLFRSREG